MRTLQEAERKLDEALASGAAAVEMMERQLKDARHMLVAAVLAAGGSIDVSQRHLISCVDATLTVTNDLAGHGVRLTATR